MTHDERAYGSTSLFVDITTITVDPAYLEAAARRALQDETPGQRRLPSLLLVSSLLAVGGIWGVAARQTYDRAPAAERIRLSLVDDARERKAATDLLARQASTLRRETDEARRALLTRTAAERALSDELARLQLVTGGARVTGPGLVVRLDDARGDEAGRVTDVDLQAVVNALWSAGAEAVSVNDRRVAALTAIRAAGETILVDYETVTAPYVVAAVGDADRLEPAFADSATARRFRTWVEAFGIEFSIRRDDDLDLPESEKSTLRYARPVPPPTARPSAKASTGPGGTGPSGTRPSTGTPTPAPAPSASSTGGAP